MTAATVSDSATGRLPSCADTTDMQLPWMAGISSFSRFDSSTATWTGSRMRVCTRTNMLVDLHQREPEQAGSNTTRPFAFGAARGDGCARRLHSCATSPQVVSSPTCVPLTHR